MLSNVKIFRNMIKSLTTLMLIFTYPRNDTQILNSNVGALFDDEQSDWNKTIAKSCPKFSHFFSLIFAIECRHRKKTGLAFVFEYKQSHWVRKKNMQIIEKLLALIFRKIE